METTTSGYAASGPARIWYEVHGEPAAERVPLLLIHGSGSTIGSNFAELIPLLTPDRQVIAIEEQGHGHTRSAGGPLTYEGSAADAAAVLDHLGVERADVLGFSTGGRVAARLALARPGLVRRLVLASAFFRRDGMVDGFWDGIGAATIDQMPPVYLDYDRALNPDPAHQQLLFDLDADRTRASADWPPEDLAALGVPVLVLAGDRDVVTAAHAAWTAAAIPGARLLVVPGSHGDYLGEVLAAGGDLTTLRATVPFLTRFLDDD
jgi:pimeloyl-ACP methyl ester carboxylesterase